MGSLSGMILEQQIGWKSLNSPIIFSKKHNSCLLP